MHRQARRLGDCSPASLFWCFWVLLVSGLLACRNGVQSSREASLGDAGSFVYLTLPVGRLSQTGQISLVLRGNVSPEQVWYQLFHISFYFFCFILSFFWLNLSFFAKLMSYLCWFINSRNIQKVFWKWKIGTFCSCCHDVIKDHLQENTSAS